MCAELEAIALRDILPRRDDPEIGRNVQSGNKRAFERDFVVNVQSLTGTVSSRALRIDFFDSVSVGPCRDTLKLVRALSRPSRQILSMVPSAKRRRFRVKAQCRIRSAFQRQSTPKDGAPIILFALAAGLHFPRSTRRAACITISRRVQALEAA